LVRAYVQDFEKIVRLCHNLAKDKGWWETKRNDGELIALMHSELSEALEELRNKDGRSNVTKELVDCCIRIFDYCGGRNLNFAQNFAGKMVVNFGRPHRHNKKF
jgi:NTP pyrophosphatase (non-canonical NTP hydrolase)